MMGATYFLGLLCLGFGITTQAQDCSRPLPGPSMALKGTNFILQSFPNGSSVSFACGVGYVPAGGSPVIHCIAGTWSPVTLKCRRKNCGVAGEVENGITDYREGTEFGDKIVITCNTGYSLVGKREIVCGFRGWTARLPACEAITCDPPSMVLDGTFSPDKQIYEYGETVKYSCGNGFAINGSESISCSDDGTFTPDPPTCVRVQCDVPSVENANWVEGFRPPYEYKATLTFQCRPGYAMRGDSTVSCDINSEWSPGLPRCEPTLCKLPIV